MSVDRTQFALPQRVLHWLMAACILAMLFLGVGMVSTVSAKYLTLVEIHKSLGMAILVLVLVRLALRIYYGAPALPEDLPVPVKLAAWSSMVMFYALMIVMPLLGWAMLSAARYPVVAFGMHLPPIAPASAPLHAVLWKAHQYLAFLFFALILAHVGAILTHKLIRNDGIFETMAGGEASTSEDADVGPQIT